MDGTRDVPVPLQSIMNSCVWSSIFTRLFRGICLCNSIADYLIEYLDVIWFKNLICCELVQVIWSSTGGVVLSVLVFDLREKVKWLSMFASMCVFVIFCHIMVVWLLCGCERIASARQANQTVSHRQSQHGTHPSQQPWHICLLSEQTLWIYKLDRRNTGFFLILAKI